MVHSKDSVSISPSSFKLDRFIKNKFRPSLLKIQWSNQPFVISFILHSFEIKTIYQWHSWSFWQWRILSLILNQQWLYLIISKSINQTDGYLSSLTFFFLNKKFKRQVWFKKKSARWYFCLFLKENRTFFTESTCSWKIKFLFFVVVMRNSSHVHWRLILVEI